MENNSKTRACTTYRKDFTPEEKVKYNEYIKQRMRVYHDSEKGRKARAAYYQLKKQESKSNKVSLCQLLNKWSDYFIFFYLGKLKYVKVN
jgi:hypothetical protein